MAQGTPDGMTTRKQLTPADTQSLIAMKYFIDAQLKSIGEIPEHAEDAVSGSVTEDAQSKYNTRVLESPDESIPDTVRSELETAEIENDGGAKLTDGAVEKPIEKASFQETPLPIEESSKTTDESLGNADEPSKTTEESVISFEKVATPTEEFAKPIEHVGKAPDKNFEATESIEQVAVTAPVETPDSVGLKTPEATNFETLEVEKDALPTEVIDAADINQDLEMTG